MVIEWSEFAVSDRNAIFDYIEADSPKAAADIDNRIERSIERLLSFPEKGRPGRVDGTRELVVSRTPNVVAYCVQRKVIRILRVLHGAQQWPEAIS